jgi:hypothetical protein
MENTSPRKTMFPPTLPHSDGEVSPHNGAIPQKNVFSSPNLGENFSPGMKTPKWGKKAKGTAKRRGQYETISWEDDASLLPRP